MKNKKPLCFIVMGFGEKQDPLTNRMVDLDVSYRKIIKPAVEQADCICVRGDEIKDTGLIDKSMYALLYQADVVVADISTYNPNAIYELGVRHVLKPYSTIVLKEKGNKIPFDIDHVRVMQYNHLEKETSEQDLSVMINKLKDLILNVLKNQTTDSPIYTLFSQITEPKISDDEISNVIKTLRNNEETIYALTSKAQQLKDKEKFVEAEQVWKRLRKKFGEEKYYIQQQAFCRYKSHQPTKIKSLTDALMIISEIKNPIDTESLGITGAINKRLWEETQDSSYLDAAIENYEKGWNILKDYYNGENYANCLRYKYIISEGDEKVYYRISEKKVRNSVIELLLKNLEEVTGEDKMWRYASLSNCYYGIGDCNKGTFYEKKMYELNPRKWCIDTFKKTQKLLLTNKI